MSENEGLSIQQIQSLQEGVSTSLTVSDNQTPSGVKPVLNELELAVNAAMLKFRQEILSVLVSVENRLEDLENKAKEVENSLLNSYKAGAANLTDGIELLSKDVKLEVDNLYVKLRQHFPNIRL